jgi:hypothetical protein
MNNLIQSITAYTSALEQKLSALEARVAQLEQQIEEANEAMGRLGERLEAKGERLEEPEIEVELVMEDEEEEVSVDQETLEIIEDTTEPEPVAEPIAEPVIEPMVEPAPIVELEPQVEPEPIVEPTPVVEKPATRPVPQQTSLFGTTVEDIRQAISLGDRFLFQRELFGGNGELMQKTLDEINALGSLSEAMEYVADTFEWDNESTAVKLFENVLKRRFGN